MRIECQNVSFDFQAQINKEDKSPKEFLPEDGEITAKINLDDEKIWDFRLWLWLYIGCLLGSEEGKI